MNIYVEDNKICIESDYSTEFVKEARKLNGKWSGKAWKFDIEDEALVRKALMKVYGEDGRTTVETVNVELTIDDELANYSSVELFGRVLAKRFSRDSKVKLHDSVVIKEGGFKSSGGSMKNPRLESSSDTVLLVKKVPFTLVEKELKNHKYNIRVISDKKIDKDALLKEKEDILKRLAEIDTLLK